MARVNSQFGTLEAQQFEEFLRLRLGVHLGLKLRFFVGLKH